MPIVAAPTSVPATLQRPGSNIVMPSSTRGDRAQQIIARHVGRGGVERGRQQHGDHARRESGEDEPEQLRAAHVDPGQARRLVGLAREDHVQSEPRVLQQEGGEQRGAGRPEDQRRHAETLPRPRARKRGSQRPTNATPPVTANARPLATDAVARRCDQRWNLQSRDQHAVERARRRADGEARRQPPARGIAVVDQAADDAPRRSCRRWRTRGRARR